ncbi:hypothetical protein ACVW1C_003582 [Bradyrhizobium sp. USDA 4011]
MTRPFLFVDAGLRWKARSIRRVYTQRLSFLRAGWPKRSKLRRSVLVGFAGNEAVLARDLDIIWPKRTVQTNDAWERFFPYYAGYPELFASKIISSAGLPPNSLTLDPWNGSGTTTYAASSLGLSSVGLDLNPAMVVIGRARLLPVTEADSLIPICKSILSFRDAESDISADEPLLGWFGPETAKHIRSIEGAICAHLVGPWTISDCGLKLDNLSGIAAAFYVALFSVCRSVCQKFRATNPTWFRHAKSDERRVSLTRPRLEALLLDFVTRMSETLRNGDELRHRSRISTSVCLEGGTGV